jgi:hypothetical protein
MAQQGARRHALTGPACGSHNQEVLDFPSAQAHNETPAGGPVANDHSHPVEHCVAGGSDAELPTGSSALVLSHSMTGAHKGEEP